MFIANFKLKTSIQKKLSNLLEIIDFPLLHPKRELQKRALIETVDYIEQNMIHSIAMDTARDVLEFALRDIQKKEGAFLEFGVFKGATINFMAKLARERKIYGFDSFEGLPESWSGNASDFNAKGKLPKVPKNVELVKGYFDATLPVWIKERNESIALIHIDCDIYSSTRTIFENLKTKIGPGTIIVFDEYFGYPGWKHHEYKAFQEFVKENGVEYSYLYFARIQCALRIDKNNSFQGTE